MITFWMNWFNSKVGSRADAIAVYQKLECDDAGEIILQNHAGVVL